MCKDPDSHEATRISVTDMESGELRSVSISLSLGEAWGAWKLHPSNSITQKLFLLAQYGTNFQNFEVMIAFINAIQL